IARIPTGQTVVPAVGNRPPCPWIRVTVDVEHDLVGPEPKSAHSAGINDPPRFEQVAVKSSSRSGKESAVQEDVGRQQLKRATTSVRVSDVRGPYFDDRVVGIAQSVVHNQKLIRMAAYQVPQRFEPALEKHIARVPERDGCVFRQRSDRHLKISKSPVRGM